jgi:hypothetical protein
VSFLHITKVVGLALGAAACSALLLGTHITRPAGAVDAALTLTSAPTGELAVTPAGTVLAARELRPGARSVSGSLVVRNQTGIALDVRLRARPVSGDLDADARLRITAGARTLFAGTLGALRGGTRRLAVPSGQGRRLHVSVSLNPGDHGRAQGRSDAAALELTSSPSSTSP